jgi:hypothetical protein
VTTFVDRSDATDEEFQAAVDRFGIFAEEERVEAAARAMWDAQMPMGSVPTGTWAHAEAGLQRLFRKMATAAVAAVAPRDGLQADDYVLGPEIEDPQGRAG